MLVCVIVSIGTASHTQIAWFAIRLLMCHYRRSTRVACGILHYIPVIVVTLQRVLLGTCAAVLAATHLAHVST